MAAEPLRGRRVLVTRPAERAEGLVRAIEAAGGVARRFPVIEIEPCPLPWAGPDTPIQYSAILFVSPAAAAHGVEALGLTPGFAPPIGAVGAATWAALTERGFAVAIEPVESQDSEGLLRAPELAADRIAGRSLLIVRGEGGREDLAEGLMARGAAVDYAEVYRRRRPVGLDPAVAADCDIVTATSTEGVANLVALLDEAAREQVRRRPLAVNSERIAAAAGAHGFVQASFVAPEPGDAGMMAAIRAAAATLDQGPSESA